MWHKPRTHTIANITQCSTKGRRERCIGLYPSLFSKPHTNAHIHTDIRTFSNAIHSLFSASVHCCSKPFMMLCVGYEMVANTHFPHPKVIWNNLERERYKTRHSLFPSFQTWMSLVPGELQRQNHLPIFSVRRTELYPVRSYTLCHGME